MYEQMTFEAIVAGMLKGVPQNVDRREGSILYDAVCGAALELANLYVALDVVLNEVFADTASREYLIRRAAERGITPEPATKAVVSGSFDVTVPAGSRFSLGELHYKVLDQQSDGSYRLECETPGSGGNQSSGELLPVDYLEGLTVAKLTGVLILGEDEEDTEVFRKRYLSSLTGVAFGGNQEDYRQKVTALDGVGGVRVVPTPSGAGTVGLTIKAADQGVPSAALVQAVQAAVDPADQPGAGLGLAPIGHQVTVSAASWAEIDVAAVLTCQEGYTVSGLQESAEAVIDDYLLELRSRWPADGAIVVRISQVETRLLNLPGVLDVTGVTLNGQAKNCLLAADALPKRGTFSGT